MKLKLKAARVNAGYTQDAVCHAVGVTKPVLIGWEKGLTYPTKAQLERLRGLYGMPPAIVFTDNDGKTIKTKDELRARISKVKEEFRSEA